MKANQSTSFKIADIINSPAGRLNPHLQEEKEKKPSKYRNTPTEVDGTKFDSEREAKRYKELKWQLKHGLIGFLELQVPYELNPGGAFSYVYICDFRYRDRATGELIIEDSKGHRTAEYKRKRRLMKKIHGITIKET